MIKPPVADPGDCYAGGKLLMNYLIDPEAEA